MSSDEILSTSSRDQIGSSGKKLDSFQFWTHFQCPCIFQYLKIRSNVARLILCLDASLVAASVRSKDTCKWLIASILFKYLLTEFHFECSTATTFIFYISHDEKSNFDSIQYEVYFIPLKNETFIYKNLVRKPINSSSI